MASDTYSAHLAIEARIESQWGDTTEVAWGNVDFQPPGNEEWLQVSVLWGETYMETMEPTAGNRLYGLVQLDLYGPKGRGLGDMLELVDTARDILNRWEGSGVQFGASSAPVPIEDDQFARLSIRTPFDVVEET